MQSLRDGNRRCAQVSAYRIRLHDNYLCFTPVDSDYFSPLDANLMRMDHASRPELSKGTVDFRVPPTYWAQEPPPRIKPLYTSPIISPPQTPSLSATFSAKSITALADPHRPPKPMDYVFLIEVTYDAVSKGFVRSVCEGILHTLYGDPDAGVAASFPANNRICIITFDGSLQFYNLAVSYPSTFRRT